MINVMAIAIKSAFDEVGAGAKWDDGMFFSYAPEETTGSYCIYNNISSSKDEIMGSAKAGITTVVWDFMLVSKDDSDGAVITNMINQLNTIYQWTELTITGFTHIKTQRISIGPTIFEDEIWSVVVTYEISVFSN